MAAYLSGDPYLAFATQAGAVPAGATKADARRRAGALQDCARSACSTPWGQTPSRNGWAAIPRRRASSFGCTAATYPRFWHWSDAVVDYANLYNDRYDGVRVAHLVGPEARTLGALRNFPMQANGAEMLRLACCFATERGVRVCAPVHDALLIEAPIAAIDDAVSTAQQAMSDASAVVLDGFRLRSEAKVILHPDRYMDDRGRHMWDAVWAELATLDAEHPGHPRTPVRAPMQQEVRTSAHPSNLISPV